jgi:hypothetical protein
MKKLLLTLILCSFAGWAHAISPNPRMDFSFTFNTPEPLTVDAVRSEQIQCADSLCMSAKPLGDYGAQRMDCTASACRSVAYEYEPFQKLIITFSDGVTRESEVFPAPKALRASFNVVVEPNALRIQQISSQTDTYVWKQSDAWQALFLILLLELFAAAAYLRYSKKSFVILYSVALANLLTTAISWYWLARYVTGGFLLWIFCVLAETLIVKGFNRHRICLKDSFILSLVINITSYSLGMIIAFSLSQL